MAYACGLGSQDAQDVVQSALLTLLAKITALKDSTRLEAWFAAIVRNEVRMLRRAESRGLRSQLRLFDEPISIESTDASTPALRQAFDRLPASNQNVLRERYVAGRSYRDTSQRLGTTESAIKSALQRARKNLEQEISMSPSTPGVSAAIGLAANDVDSLAWAARFAHPDPDNVIHNVLLEPGGHVVATDGHRLIRRAVPALRALDAPLLVAPNGYDSLNGRASLSVHLDEVRIELEADTLAWGITDGAFPDYTSVVPAQHRYRLAVQTSLFADALKSVARFLEPEHPAIDGYQYLPVVGLTLDTEKRQVGLFTDQTLGYVGIDDAGAASPPAPGKRRWRHAETLVVEQIDGFTEAFRMYLNARYLAESLGGVQSEDVVIEISSAHKPLVVRSTDHMSLTMPVG